MDSSVRTITIPSQAAPSLPTLGQILEEEMANRRTRETKVLNDARALGALLNEFWARELTDRYRMTFDPPARYEYYRGTEQRSCGGITQLKANNAYYCFPEDEEHVAFDLDWLQHYLVDHPRGATTFLILAHEWGHAVQDTWREHNGGDTWNPPYLQELNADCLAGVFIAAGIKEKAIVEETGDAETMFRWLYEAGPAPWLDPGTHGTGDRRQGAFRAGLERDTAYCRTQY